MQLIKSQHFSSRLLFQQWESLHSFSALHQYMQLVSCLTQLPFVGIYAIPFEIWWRRETERTHFWTPHHHIMILSSHLSLFFQHTLPRFVITRGKKTDTGIQADQDRPPDPWILGASPLSLNSEFYSPTPIRIPNRISVFPRFVLERSSELVHWTKWPIMQMSVVRAWQEISNYTKDHMNQLSLAVKGLMVLTHDRFQLYNTHPTD